LERGKTRAVRGGETKNTIVTKAVGLILPDKSEGKEVETSAEKLLGGVKTHFVESWIVNIVGKPSSETEAIIKLTKEKGANVRGKWLTRGLNTKGLVES